MPSYDNLVKVLGLLACGVGSGAAIRLYCQSLHRRYKVLFLFLWFHVARSFSLLAVSEWSSRPLTYYAWTWIITEPAIWLFYILVSLNLYTLVLQKYKGLQTVGRWVFLFAIVLGIAISGASLIPTLNQSQDRVPIVSYYALIGRGIMFSLVVFILLILFFLSRYPISLSRNIVIHAVVWMVFLISHSMGYLVRNVRGIAVTRTVNVVHLAVVICCYAAWMLLLNDKGEDTKMVVRREWSPAEEKRLVDQLTAINSSLLRATRKKDPKKDPDKDDD